MSSVSNESDKQVDAELVETKQDYYESVRKTQGIFDEEFGLMKKLTPKKSEIVQKYLESGIESCSKLDFTDFVPILKWLPKYSMKDNLLNDIIGGVTVGIMHVPQGMAYSTLANMRPANGLYTSLIPPLIYMLFGTSRHVSLGVFAVVSLMVGSANLRVTHVLVEQDFNNSTLIFQDEAIYDSLSYDYRVRVVTSLALLVGFIQIIMGLLRLDFLMFFLSDQVIAGFTTGAAVHVFTAQQSKILGVRQPSATGAGKLFTIYGALYNSILNGEVNSTTFFISLGTIVFLVICKEYINQVIKKACKIKLPIPYDLIVVICGTIASNVFDLKQYNVKTVGEIPTGLPVPRVPSVSLFSYLFADAIAIAIVVLVVTVSMGKLFAKKHAYALNIRQEFYALGVMECVSSFFPVWPSSTALARTLVYEAAGTKTQLATAFSSVMLIFVIFFAGPLMEKLPMCLLSCIIIVALKGMFMQLKQLRPLWKSNKIDCFAFLAAFLGTVLVDVVEGLAIGIAFTLAAFIWKIQQTEMIRLGRMSHRPNKTYFLEFQKYRDAAIINGTLWLRYSAPIMFFNIENFKDELQKHVRAVDEEIERQQEHERNRQNIKPDVSAELLKRRSGVEIIKEDPNKKKMSFLEVNKNFMNSASTVVLDLSAVPFVDCTGAEILVELLQEYKASGITLFYSGLNHAIIDTLSNSPAFQKFDGNSYLFPSLQDAVESISRSAMPAMTVKDDEHDV